MTQLSDIIDVKVFTDLPAVDSPEKTSFFQSGVIVRNALLDQLAAAPGKIAELPFWNDLDSSDEVNYSDDTSNTATASDVAQGSQVARKAFINKGWKSADLASELVMGDEAMEHIRKKTDGYFTKQFSRRMISTAVGLLEENVTNDSSDMVIDIAAESVATQSAATKFSRSAFTESLFTLGDTFDSIKAIGVHSGVYKQIVDQDDYDMVADSEGNLTPTYLGKRIIVDDALPVIAGTTDGVKYVSVLFGEGMFGYGEADALVPVEVARNASEGNGGGTEELWVRKTWLLHPFGYKDVGTPAGLSYTLAELAAGDIYDRVVDRKNVPLTFLVTN